MISFHTGMPGENTLYAKAPAKWIMVFPEKHAYLQAKAKITFTAPEQITCTFMIEP